MDEWLLLQRAWMHFEDIFSGLQDVQAQLPQLTYMFQQVDEFWKETFRQVRQNFPGAMEAMCIPNLLSQLRWANSSLDQIHNSFEDYLELKRWAFPRFCFLSNDEVLTMLAVPARNPHAVQEHLFKCFDSINRVTFREGTNQIYGMSDMAKEIVEFHEEVTAGPQVEAWLNSIEQQMVMGLYQSTKAAMTDYPENPIFRKE